MTSILTKNQLRSLTKTFKDQGRICHIRVNVRYDDECGNEHNSFGITSNIYVEGRWDSGGCQHEEVYKHFPELRHLIKWHLMSSDGPMHYFANSLYHASDKDCYGKRRGEPSHYTTHICFRDFPITLSKDKAFLDFVDQVDISCLKIEEVCHREPETFRPKYTFKGYGEGTWHKCPFDTRQEAVEWKRALQNHKWKMIQVPTRFSEGKKPDLKAARSSAIWPDAELEDFTKENLEARLPDLIATFKKDMEEFGFIF